MLSAKFCPFRLGLNVLSKSHDNDVDEWSFLKKSHSIKLCVTMNSWFPEHNSQTGANEHFPLFSN